MSRVLLGLAAAALIAAAPPASGRSDPDTRIDPPIGAVARAKNGIEPLARPAADLGMADDPADATATPAPAPVTTQAVPASR